MIFGLFTVFLASLFVFLLSPLLLLVSGKIFRVGQLTFKKIFIANLLIFVSSLFFNAIIVIFVLNISEKYTFINILIGFLSLIITIWIIKRKLVTTIPRSIGILLTQFTMMVFIALSLRAFVVQAFKIPSGAMEQTLLTGDHILVNKFVYHFTQPKRFEVIVYKYPWEEDRNFIKRVIGLPGERVQVRDQQVYVNEQPLHEPYVYYTTQ